MIHFKLAPHTSKPGDLVEIWNDDKFIGAIYPWKERGIRVMSRHMQHKDIVEMDSAQLGPPAVIVNILPE